MGGERIPPYTRDMEPRFSRLLGWKTGLGGVLATLALAGGMAWFLRSSQARLDEAARSVAEHYRGVAQLPGHPEHLSSFGKIVAKTRLLPEHVRALDRVARQTAYSDTSRARGEVQAPLANRRWANAHDVVETLYGHVDEEGRVQEDWIRALENGLQGLQGLERERREAGIRFLRALNRKPDEAVREALLQIGKAGQGKAMLNELRDFKQRLQTLRPKAAPQTIISTGSQYARFMPTAQAARLKRMAVQGVRRQFAGKPFRIRSRG